MAFEVLVTEIMEIALILGLRNSHGRFQCSVTSVTLLRDGHVGKLAGVSTS